MLDPSKSLRPFEMSPAAIRHVDADNLRAAFRARMSIASVFLLSIIKKYPTLSHVSDVP